MQLYLSPIGGMSGDMFVACLIGLGAGAEQLFEPLAQAGLAFDWRLASVKRGGISALKVDIGSRDDRRERRLPEILALVERLPLPAPVLQKAQAAFRLLAALEAEIHGTAADAVHFHELGAVDSIVDVVAGIYGVHLLGADAVYAEPAPLGRGWVGTAHGRLPLPAPATVRLLEGIACYHSGRQGELVTPTGALLLRILNAAPLPPNSFVFRKSVFGAGGRDDSDYPNVLAAHLIEPAAPPIAAGELVQAVFDIDDMSGQDIAYLRERLAEVGASEVAVMPASYKKGRPGYLVQSLVPIERLADFAAAVFRHSSTFGFRYWPVVRRVLERSIVEKATALGTVRVKSGTLPDGAGKDTLEYEDIAALAKRLGIPLAEARRRLESELRGEG